MSFQNLIGIFSLTLFYPLVFLFSELAPSFFGFSHSPFVFLEFLVEEGAVKGGTSVANDKNGVGLHLKGGRQRGIDLAIFIPTLMDVLRPRLQNRHAVIAKASR